MSWASTYVGIPYADRGRFVSGCDCWGLACLVYHHELGISLPSYVGAYVSAEERAEVHALIGAAEQSGPWSPTSKITAYDLLLFRRGQMRSHIGIAIDERRMLHMDGDDQSRIVDYTAPRWSARFCGGYRHADRGCAQ